MKNTYIYIFILSLVFASCESELDLEPAQSISVGEALATEGNIANILIGTYNKAGERETFGGDTQIISDLLGADGQVTWNGTFLDPRQFFNKTILLDNGFVENHWNNSYEVINQANLVIDNLDVIESSTDEKNRIEGEAKFLRALTYFDLVKLYGLPYEASTNNAQLGVPLMLTGITDYSVDLDIGRSSVEEIYTQIIKDLTDAETLLPSSNSYFADQYAAKALLARVYFQQGDYGSARDAADEVLEKSGHSLAPTFADTFNNDADGQEDIFAFQVTSQTGENDLITFYASEGNGGRGGDISLNQAYFNLFDDPNDVRLSFNYVSPTTGGTLTSKYTNQFSNVPILRIAEMHLIRAESNFRENTTTGMDPLSEINALRSRSEAGPLASVTLDDFFEERQRELAFEGHLLFDHKRTGRAVGSLAADSNELVLPIPQSELDTNDSIEPNPGYN